MLKACHFTFLYTQVLRSSLNSIETSCKLKFPESGGCCTEKEKDCYVGSDRLGNHCSCSANCYDNQNLKCCPDIGCPSKFSSLLIKNMFVSITMDTSAAEVQILNMAQYLYNYECNQVSKCVWLISVLWLINACCNFEP